MEITGVIIGSIGAMMGVGSGILWLLSQHASSTRKKYAAENDFKEIRKNQAELFAKLDNFFQDINHRFDGLEKDIQEIKFNTKKQ